MKTDKSPSSSTALTVGIKNDHSKLVSLLALAAGAAAMPQTSNADIIYTVSGATVSWDGFRSFSTLYGGAGALPGNVQLGFDARRSGSFSFSSVRYITGGKRGSGYLQLKLALVNQPLLWNQIGGALATHTVFASAQSSHNSGSFIPSYMAFEFKDSSQPSTPMRFGWVGLSLANGNLDGGGNWPLLTVSGWAYDNTGAQIPMGAVPEPSAMALLALGALTLGAKGVRSWRRNRSAASQS